MTFGRLAFVADLGTQNFNLKTKFDMENNTLTNHENGNDANRLLAAAIISAVLKSDWSYMLTLFPEGVEHRTYKYKEVSDFDDWETYEDFTRYVYPAQSKLIELCLNKALECLSNGCR
ncbi:MAG: hypothetical protein QM280_02370 [Bacteroidota bacterium]|nr:hypothetical protein [Bacteroidota bacterium]